MHEIISPYVNSDNNCLYCALGNVLSWQGWTAEKIDHLFDGQLSFYYSFRMKSEYVDFTIIEDYPINFLLEKEPLAQRLARLLLPYGIISRWKEADDPESAWDGIYDISRERPLVLFFDHFTLPYHIAYQKNHGAHFVTMTGLEGSYPLILDSIRDIRFSGLLEWDLKNQERILTADLANIKNALIDLLPNGRCLPTAETDRMVIGSIVEEMTSTSLSNNRTWGIEAMNLFYEDMSRLFHSPDFADEIQNNPRLNSSLESLFISLLRVSQQRKRFAAFLSSSPLLLSGAIGRFDWLIQGYEELGELWTQVRNIFYMGYRRISPSKLINSLTLMEELIDKETRLVNQLKNIV